MKRIISTCFVLLVPALVLSAPTEAGELRHGDPAARSELPNPLDMFQAMDSGQIDVKFIPLNAARANVLIKNKTDRPLHILLPESFAAVPVLGQLGQQFGAAGDGGGGGASQGVGGGLNAGGNQGLGNGNQGFGNGNQGFGNRQQGGGQQGNGLGLGFMRIPPEKTRKLKATTVCLEYGKPEPNPRLAYRMIPISQLSEDDRVDLLCKKLGRGEISQNTAQAAAWHLANHMNWEQLARINRIESRYVGNIKRFKPGELRSAKNAVQAITEQTTPRSDSHPHGDSYSQLRSRGRN
jgi:hypothetical protein